MVIAVFGATGFLGRYVVDNLGMAGHHVIVPTHGDDMQWRHLKPLCNLGKFYPQYFDANQSEESIKDAIRGCNVVVNLIGKHYETKMYPGKINYSFDDVNVRIPRLIAKAARELDVLHMVHVSALSASETS